MTYDETRLSRLTTQIHSLRQDVDNWRTTTRYMMAVAVGLAMLLALSGIVQPQQCLM